ncbi:choice-of-anchor D domain-containing protein [Subsaximicrobium wynnwilliamsii]|uniref:Choice-of-anchor D domain-containing protein n=1 Tax=Subsaximicrobium wynnwilliamsii TaxID=291179 RepID=A0A5C6ZPX5_9FLAO|nr:LamG-like jellyroll fold domain-containing protein [Subsaximicrobium wynnwilliamsii]TXD81640.1 choice-of-anchor D domain-containing protein [Subsaximicrobium wynnwilliamsii]TXD91033.1 choice-of-anchor D domain-containing protein [Subsaximicrobium wynnwilliamsii]TXE01088.1 choice-of-anchor D domain-containing protein [Subsaximicrobium wynnwilliamsii]
MKNFSLKTLRAGLTLLLLSLAINFSFSQDLKVQHFQEDVPEAGKVITTSTPVSALSKAFAISNNNRKSQAGIPGSGNNMSGSDMSGAMRLTSASTLEYYRDGASVNANTRFSSSIIEYTGPAGGPNEFVVRGRYAIALNGNNNSITQGVGGVTNSRRSIPFITGILNSATNADADSGTAIAYLEDNGILHIRKGSNSNNVTVYITLVEFIGSNWSVLHADSGDTAADTGTLTLRENANGTGSTVNVPNWSNAIIFGQHIGDYITDGTNDAIADNWPIFRPGSNNQHVDWEFHNQHDSNGNNKHFVHVLINNELNVTRYQDDNNAANETAIDISDAGLSDTSQAMIVGSSISSGSGNAYGRGWRNYYLKSITEAAHWAHRRGNDMSHELQIVDFSNMNTLNCNAAVSTFPYNESFESGLGLWSQAVNNDIDWNLKSGGTASNDTGPNNAASGNYYLYTEASDPNFNKNAILESPCFDLTTNDTPQFSFSYHMYGSNMGNLYVELSLNGNSNPIEIWSQNGQDQTENDDPWKTVELDLSAYAGQTVKLRFRGLTGNNYRSDMAIDNISFIDVPPTPDIVVKGNNILINNGANTVNMADGTNYGSHDVGVPSTNTFTIENLGYANLDISSISLSNSIDFSIVAPAYQTTMAHSEITTLSIQFNCLSNSIKSSWVTINSNDALKTPYAFLIKGESKQLFFDSDNDGVFDNVDVDDDNDGIPDSVEELDCQNSNISINTRYKILNETFGTGGRTTINTTYNAVTTYAYEDGSNPANIQGSSLGDGEYTVHNKASNGDGINNTPSQDLSSWAETNWYIGGDHTPEDIDGRMALFNASYDPGVFYTANISGVLPDVPTTYSFWVLNLIPVSGVASDRAPEILVEFRDVNDVVLYSFSTDKIPKSINGNPEASWHNFTSELILNVSEFNVYFINNETGGNGNDLAIDDISFIQSLCDTDGDGIANIFDLDSDNDGIPDSVEAGFATETNGQAYIQNFFDSNANGMHDAMEGLSILDSDGDGTPNYIDLDSDNDTVFDVDESAAGNAANASFHNGDGDVDGDGVGDGSDSDATRETDSNYDGISEYFTDGILDIYDYFSGNNFATAYGNTNQGMGNTYYVKDTDGDGIPDYIDVTSNGSTFDISLTLYADLDANNDGIIDDTSDSDADGIVNLFDTDDSKFGSPRVMDKKLGLYFDGRNDFVEDVPIFGGYNEASMMGWIRVDPDASGTQILFGQNNIMLLVRDDKRIQARVNNTNLFSPPMPKDQWIHVAISYSSTSAQFKLYINGQEVANTSVSTAIGIDTSAFVMGKRPNANNSYFKGYMDEVRLFKKALSADEIQKMVYQEIDNNAGTVRGSVIPRNITDFVDTNNNAALGWNALERYYRMDTYRGDIVDDFSTPGIDSGTGARMHNIKILDNQSAPMPFTTKQSGDLVTALSNASQGVNGIDAVNYDWSIVKVQHDNVTYNDRQKHIGLFVDEMDANSNPIKFSIKEDSEINVSWYLKLDGFMDLEGESQLIQGIDSYLDPTSKGYIERDQQGTSNHFNYNYWGSPVNTNGTTFTVGGVLRDGFTPTSPEPVTWTSSPNGSNSNPLTLSRRWLYTFNDLEGIYPNWQSISENTPVAVGLGFTMKGGGGASEQNYTFTGKPNNGQITAPVSGGNQVLVGNPYPSAIDAYLFIAQNDPALEGSLQEGALYFWEHAPSNNTHILRNYLGGYATLNLTGGVAATTAPSGIAGIGNAAKVPKQYIPVGQGFFVTGDSDGGLIQFNNSQRIFRKESISTSVFLRGTNDENTTFDDGDGDETSNDQFIRLDFITPENAVRHLLLGFMDNANATDNVDYGYDAPINDSYPNDMGFNIDGGQYVIQGVGGFDITKSYPLNIKLTTGGTVQIALSALENFDTDIDVYIHDSVLGTYTQFNNTNFQITLEAGDYPERFSLVFQEDQTLSTIDTEFKDIIANFLQNTDEIYIRTPKSIQVKQVYLINITGQTVGSWNATNLPLSNEIKIPVQNVSEGNYILQVETNLNTYNKKITIKY